MAVTSILGAGHARSPFDGPPTGISDHSPMWIQKAKVHAKDGYLIRFGDLPDAGNESFGAAFERCLSAAEEAVIPDGPDSDRWEAFRQAWDSQVSELVKEGSK